MDPADALAAAVDRQCLLSRSQLLAAGVSDGGLTRALARGRVVRVRRRVYALEPLPALPRFLVTDAGVDPALVAQVRAALLELGPRAVAAGRTAAALRGWGLLHEPRRTVEVEVGHGHDAAATGVRVRQVRELQVEDLVPRPGLAALPVTPAVRTVLHCSSTLSRLDATVVADSALRAGAVSVADLRAAVARLPGRREAARARAVVSGCDPEAGSVLESVQRVRMALAGLDGFATQVVLHRKPVLRVDFCFEVARLVVEVDGARWHQEPARDQARDNLLAALGWRVLRYSWRQVVHDGPTVIAQIQAALSAGGSTVHLPLAAAA